MKTVFALFLLSAVLLMGCQQAPSQPTAVPTAVVTAEPSATAQPTQVTAAPTQAPTATPLPTPVPTLPASCVFDSDCGAGQVCNLALGTCEVIGATPMPTTSPTPMPSVNESARIAAIATSLQDIANPVLSALSPTFQSFTMPPSNYDVSGKTPQEYFVESAFKVSQTVPTGTITRDVAFGLKLQRVTAPLGSVSNGNREVDHRTVYVPLYSNFLSAKFINGNSSAFFCNGGDFAVFTFIDSNLNTVLASQNVTEPILYLTGKLLAACPA